VSDSDQRGRLSYWLLLACFVLLLQIAFSGKSGSQGGMADSRCESCHLAGRESNASNAGKLLATQERLCADCHPDAVQVSHPSGIHPRIDTSPRLPLDWNGRLTCSSCHQIHTPAHGQLRVAERGRGFCHLCHDEAFFRAMRDGGHSLDRSAHLAAAPLPPGLTIDAYSLACMECHNEQASNQVGVLQIDSMGTLNHDSSSMNHPIGRLYDEAARYGGYRKREQLKPEIILPDGRIGCVSCHAGYSNPHGEVLLQSGGSALCMECHDL
jgi:predicted CXXCH cytochrome family protein